MFKRFIQISLATLFNIGNRENYNKVQKEIEDNPFVYKDFHIKNKVQEKWLGDQLNENGLAATNLATVVSRRGKVTAAIFEIKALLEDVRLHSLGGLECGLEIFNLAVLPFLLNNSDTWTCLDDKTIKELDKLQVLFLSVLLSVPTSTPRPAIFFDTGSITMEFEIMKRKLNLVHHIKNLDDNCLAKEIYNEQIRNN